VLALVLTGNAPARAASPPVQVTNCFIDDDGAGSTEVRLAGGQDSLLEGPHPASPGCGQGSSVSPPAQSVNGTCGTGMQAGPCSASASASASASTSTTVAADGHASLGAAANGQATATASGTTPGTSGIAAQSIGGIVSFTVSSAEDYQVSGAAAKNGFQSSGAEALLQGGPTGLVFSITDANGGGAKSGTLQPGTYTLVAFIDARANAVVDLSDPSRGQSQGTATASVTLTLGGPANPTGTSLNCPGDSDHPQTAGDPGVAITCTVSVQDTCATSCSPSVPTGSVTIDFADGTADPSCTLTPTSNPSLGTCDVSVTPSAAGSHEIGADYAGDTAHAPSAGRTTFSTNCDPAQGQQVRVGNAVALGCFEERRDANGNGTGVFETTAKAWIGGFEAVPDQGVPGLPAPKLVVDTNTPEVREEGGNVDLRIDGTPLGLPVADLPVTLSSAEVELGRSGSIEKAVLDLPLDGKLKVSWSSGGTAALLEGEVSVSKVTAAVGLVTTTGSGSSADFKFSAKLSNGKGLELSTAEAKIDEIDVVPKIFKLTRTLALKDLTFSYSRKTDPATGLSRPFWSAGGMISLPFTKTPIDVGGKVFIFDGSLAGGGLAVDGINKPVPDTPLFLQKLSGDLVLLPDFGVNATVGATFGPRLAGKQLFTLDGNLTAGALVSPLDCGNGPDPFKIDATLKFVPLEDEQLAKVDMTQRICTYASFAQLGGVNVPGLVGQDVTMSGGLEFLRGAFGYEGSQSGFVGNHGANLEGSATIKLPGAPDPAGGVILSTIGIAACGRINGIEVGFGYHWGDLTPAPFTSCDFTLYRVPASTASVSSSRAVRLPGGLPSVAFSVTGSVAAPRLRVSGPGGVAVSVAADGTLQTGRVLIAPSAGESKTYVIVKKPAGGNWRFESLGAGNAITRVAVADGLPRPRVSARLRHFRHGGLLLRYRLAPIAGQSVDFIERGPATERMLGRAHGRGGTIGFRPFIAAKQGRTILAEVIQNGVPRALITLVRYRAPAAHRPARPHVTAKRTRTAVSLRWNRVHGASGYLVIVTAGHTQLAGLFVRSRHVTIPNTPLTGAIRVTVRAASDITPPGRAATLRLKAPH
jgi:hypothetical protein